MLDAIIALSPAFILFGAGALFYHKSSKAGGDVFDKFHNFTKEPNMGLDMYLFRGGKPTEGEVMVGDWRKANMVHGFFVDECADGVDECQPISVPFEELVVLRDRCKDIMNGGIPEQLLPVKQGFFFGSYEYDEYYMMDIERTLDILNWVVLMHTDEYEYYYQASW
jgi:hypothetical protein